jgi:predicted ATPase/DNA-binding SARP family transcriptional activator
MATASRASETGTLTVRLFGVPHVSFEQRPVRFVASRTLPLFVYLLLHRDRPVARDLLAFTLWPDNSEEEARANLRRHLNRLNDALPRIAGVTWIDADKKTIGLTAGAPIDLDADRLEAASSGAEDPEAALDFYRGDLFENCDDDWLVAPRERLRAAFLELATRTAGRYRGERRYSDAIGLVGRILHVDPFREDAVRSIMTLRYESGDRAGALREFETFRRRLQAEVGAEPMHETLSLHDAIRRHALPKPGPASETQAARALPFAGREDELATLRRVWPQAARGEARAAFVSGEAGIGKSRLLREFANLTEREGARVLWGGTSAPEAMPYEPVLEALRPAVSEIANLPLAPALTGALALRFPELRLLRTDLPESVKLPDDRERSRFFDAVASALAGLTARRPTVLVLEDLHWAGEGTLGLIGAIVRTCAGCALFTLLTYREEEASGALRQLLREPGLRGSRRLGLGRLDPSACTAILARGFAADPFPEEIAAWATRLSAGNPLFLSELAREYRARAEPDRHAPGGLPPSLESTILARLARVSPAARAVAEIAAAAGSTFSVDVVHRASGWPLAEVLDALDELVDRFVVRETTAGSRGDYQFGHELIRDAALAHMPGELRARRHRRLARALVELFPERLDELSRALAEHFERAGMTAEAAHHYGRAARVAHAQFAWHEAAGFARRALAAHVAPQERFELFECVASASEKLGNAGECRAAVDAMVALADELEDDALRARALARRAESASRSGDRSREREAIDALAAIAARTSQPRLLREARRARTRRSVNDGDYAAAIAGVRSIDDIPQLQRSSSERVDDLYLLAHAEASAGNFDRSREATLTAQRIAEREAGLAERLSILRVRTHLAIEADDRAEARLLVSALLELSRTVGDVAGEADVHQNAAAVAAWSFDVASARAHLRDGLAISVRVGKLRTQASLANNAGVLENHLGLLAEARGFYDRAHDIARRIGANALVLLCRLNYAYAWYMEGDFERSLAEARIGLALAREAANKRLEGVGLTHCGAALRELGRTGEAFECLSEASALAEEGGFVSERNEALAELLPVLTARGERERAGAVAARLAAAVEADPQCLAMPADALANAAAALAACGDSASAAQLRDRAAALLAERLGRLPDDTARAAYAAIRWHRRILER